MLFILMHKVTPAMERGEKPDSSIITNMGSLMGDAREKGILHDGAGLRPSSERVRLKCTAGKCEPTRGPLTGSNELIAGFAMLKVPSMDEGLKWATRFAEIVGDVEIDVGPVVEPWDLGLMEKPKHAPLRVLAMHKASAASESGAPPPAGTAEKIAALVASMKEAGVYISAEGLLPSSKGARLRTSQGKRTWTDGPFAESKELVAGYCILRLDSLEEAKGWAERYAAILGDIELDVRAVSEG
jgi:hypothetical protein